MWEITGAEFSKSEAHTADGISIRFPRCTRIRDDKDWKSATNLPQLKVPAPGLRVCPVPPSQLWHPGHLPSCILPLPLQHAERGQEGSYWKGGAARPPGERSACIRHPGQPCALSHSLLGRTSPQASGSTLLRRTGEQRTVICADYCRNRARARKALRKPAAFACCVSSPHFPQPRAPKTDHTGCLSPEAGKGGITDILPPLRSCTSCPRSGQPSPSRLGTRGAPLQGAAVGARAPQGRRCLMRPRAPPPGSIPPAPRRLGASRAAAPTEVVRREGGPGAPRSGHGDGGRGPSPSAALRPGDPVHCSWCWLRSCCVRLRRQPLICRFPSCPALLTGPPRATGAGVSASALRAQWTAPPVSPC